MRNRFAVAVVISLSLSACGGAEPAPVAPPPAPVAPAAPSAVAEAPPPAKAEPDPERLAPIAPLTPDEQKELKAKCGAFAKAIEKAAGAGRQGAPPAFQAADVFQSVATAPVPGLKDDARDRCATLFRHDLDVYLVETMRVGAIGNLGVLQHLLDQALSRGGTLCPSAAPVPRKFDVLAKGVYVPSADDYKDAGWACLENASILDHLLAQIRVTSDPKAGTVTISARTMPLRDGKMVEYAREGRIDGLAIKWGKPEAR